MRFRMKFGLRPVTRMLTLKFPDITNRAHSIQPGDTMTVDYYGITVYYARDGVLQITRSLSAEKRDELLRQELKARFNVVLPQGVTK